MKTNRFWFQEICQEIVQNDKIILRLINNIIILRDFLSRVTPSMNDKIIEKLKCKRNLKHIGKDNQNRS